jgi:uncharacterized YigZ family protein
MIDTGEKSFATEAEKDRYFTLGVRASREMKVKGSRFIGYAGPVRDRDEAESFIREVSRKHHDATHNCFAYRLGSGDASAFRFNDDGEPSGTAGRPILDAIDSRSLTDVVCVVTRYFGGTKLGTGGLARTYGRCAGEALDGGGNVERFLIASIRIRFDYNLTGSVMGLIARYDAAVERTVYGAESEMVLRVRQSKTEDFVRELVNATSGRARVLGEEVADR